jgi:hypothetical protein
MPCPLTPQVQHRPKESEVVRHGLDHLSDQGDQRWTDLPTGSPFGPKPFRYLWLMQSRCTGNRGGSSIGVQRLRVTPFLVYLGTLFAVVVAVAVLALMTGFR